MKVPPRLLVLATALVSAASLSSCATSSTPQSRITTHPATFQALADEDRQLVMNGRIREGMSKDAVYLAWGKPATRSQSGADGKLYEVWTFTSLEPVVNHHLSIGYGVGFGGHSRYSRYRRSRSHIGFGPSIHYVPRERARVSFVDDLVTQWQVGR